MVYTAQSIEEFISKIEPFNQLSPDGISDVGANLKPLRYSMGQIMLAKDKIPPHVCIIYEGQARYIGYDPRTGLPVSLQLLSQGDIIGWLGLIRGFGCETVISDSDEGLTVLTLANENFFELLKKYPVLDRYFREKPVLTEVFDLLAYQLNQKPTDSGDISQLAQQIHPECQAIHLNQGVIKEIPPCPPGHIWVLSSGKIGNLEKGQQVEVNGKGKLSIDKSARLISLKIPETNNVTPQAPTETEISEDPWQNDDDEPINVKQSQVLLEPAEIPSAPADLLDKLPSTLADDDYRESKGKGKYPFFAGRGERQVGIACLKMLCKYFNMPFRGEIIERIVNDQIQRHSSLSLDIYGAIGELMGLNVQLIGVPAGAFTRLEPPFLTKVENSTVLVYEVSEKKIVIADPTLGGLKSYKPLKFLQRWGQQGKILLLRKNKETPEERFGLSWFVPSLIKYKWVLAEVFIASFFVQLFALANPLMVQIIIDKVIVQNSPDTLQVLGVFLVVLAVFEALLTTLRTYSFVDTTNRIDMTLGSEIIDHLLRLPLRYFEKRPVGEIATRIGELENIRQFLTGTALTVVLDAIFSVIYIAVMFIYSSLLSFVALGIIPIFIGLTLIFSPLIRRQLRAKAERNAHTQSYLVEIMSGIQTVKAQNIELRSRWEWQERYATYVGTGFKTVITSTIAGTSSHFLNQLSSLLVLWVGAYLVLKQELSLGQLIAFRIISGYVTSPILRLANLWQNFQQTALSLERLADIVDHPQEAENDRTNIPMPLIKGHVKYENVCFRFKQHAPLQLNNVSLDVAPGTFVAIVGESGAGKSTLTKLISRLYEPEAGRILIDGYDINRVELYSLRRQIGVVPQESLLFDGTVMQNIALTNPDASTEEIIHAAEVAAAHEFIMNLPNGYNTRVGERGASLSGGQRQRIAIARSVLQNPRMLVLDEATSALDYNTEAQVCHNLIHSFKDRTVFFITHRLGTIQSADLIIVMDMGSIVEMGKHEQLMAAKGRYYYLYQQQQKTQI
jgi:ATP-binding cassette subfamily B protein